MKGNCSRHDVPNQELFFLFRDLHPPFFLDLLLASLPSLMNWCDRNSGAGLGSGYGARCRAGFGGRQIIASEDDGSINHAQIRDLDAETARLDQYGADLEKDDADK
ncbi:hypothetical protein GIB67_032884 [Kingdonia uniflora]|uniref:Uncharacterized protein n=1 Tax=Kingdonia uniflora TaxID=39325 RepID=A0A7J7NBW6_9MAGN|nr:hypothetical protein GIB67_032884 [Kingdonia uniflora]